MVDLLRDGHDRDGPLAVEGRLLAGHEVSKLERDPGAAGGSFEGQHRGVRQPISGPGRPGKLRVSVAVAQVAVDLAGDVSLQAADDLLLGQAFFAAPVRVGAGGRVRAHAGDDDPPQGVVGLAVPAAVEAVPAGLSRGGRDRGDCAQVRPGGLAAQPLRVVPGGDQQQGGGIGADAVQAEQARRAGGDQRDDELIEAPELGVQELDTPA